MLMPRRFSFVPLCCGCHCAKAVVARRRMRAKRMEKGYASWRWIPRHRKTKLTGPQRHGRRKSRQPRARALRQPCSQRLHNVVVDNNGGEQDEEHKRSLVYAFFDWHADVSSHQALDEEQQND